MIFDRDLYAVACLMIKHHGEGAATYAATLADEFGAENKIDGQRHWIRVTRAIQALQRPRMFGETLN